MISASIFRTNRIPSLNRLPEEVGREERTCDNCGVRGPHILYLVPKKTAFIFYRKDHPENLHATCTGCARSAILSGAERDRIMESSNSK